jgi:hypothetical protein
MLHSRRVRAGSVIRHHNKTVIVIPCVFFVSTPRHNIKLKHPTSNTKVTRDTQHFISLYGSTAQRAMLFSQAPVQVAKMTPLPIHFHPGPFDVICARGQEAKNHSGNKFYRCLVRRALERYSKATNKYEKTLIVSEIVDEVRARSPGGGFVKRGQDGRYCEVGDHLAREKVGQNLRDSLSSQYKSSTKAKRRRREVLSAGIVNEVESIFQSSEYVSSRIEELSANMHRHGEPTPEVFAMQLFTRTNLEILEALKQDESLLSKFNKLEESNRAQ